MKDLNDKVTGGTLSASEWNEVPSEIQNVIEALGIGLSSGDLNQLGKGIAGYVANGNFYIDSGIANAYTLSVVGLKQSPPQYTDGFYVSFMTVNANTGPSTVNVAGLGVKNIKLDGGGDPLSDNISGRVELYFDLGLDVFTLLNQTSGSGSGSLSFQNVQSMIDSTALQPGMFVDTSGYKTPGDGGGNKYEIVAAGTGTADGGSFIDLSTHQAKGLFVNGLFNLKQFGVIGDGVAGSESTLIQAFFDFGAGKKLDIDGGTYNIQTPLQIDSYTELRLAKNAIIKRNAEIDNVIRNKADGVTGGFSANSNITIDGGIWDGNKSVFTTPSTMIAIGHAAEISLKNGVSKNVPSFHGIELNGVKNAVVSEWTFLDSTLTDNAEALQLDLMINAGAFPWFGPYDDTPCNNIHINDCLFNNVGSGIGSHVGVVGQVHGSIFISRCNFTALSNQGIKAYNWSGLKVTDCRFEDVDFGVTAFVLAGVVVADYIIKGNTFFNIDKDANSRAIFLNGDNVTDRRIQEVMISDNFVRKVGLHGIGVDWGKQVTISNNTVRDCGHTGVWAYGCDGFTVNGNVSVLNNTSVTATRSDLSVGVTGVNNTVNGNITGNTVGTAYIDDVTDILMRQNTINTSFTIVTTVTSSTNENLVAGVLSL